MLLRSKAIRNYSRGTSWEIGAGGSSGLLEGLVLYGRGQYVESVSLIAAEGWGQEHKRESGTVVVVVLRSVSAR